MNDKDDTCKLVDLLSVTGGTERLVTVPPMQFNRAPDNWHALISALKRRVHVSRSITIKREWAAAIFAGINLTEVCLELLDKERVLSIQFFWVVFKIEDFEYSTNK